MTLHRATNRRAFTLIEMILVLLLVALVAGIVAPTLRNFSVGAQLRDTADRFVTLTRLARVQALSTGQVHRLTIDSSKNQCVVEAENAQQLEALSGHLDGTFAIPDGLRIQMKDAQGTPRDFVEFYPNGRTQTASVHISMLEGEGSLDVKCVAPTEGFYLVNPGVPR